MSEINEISQEIKGAGLAENGAREVEGLRGCCEKTIRLHAAFNPMMVCPDCKQIIKCFKEERPFRNYLTFCRSRHRKVLSASFGDLYVVVFRSYETFR